jgi:hypothetical protein
MGVNEHLTFRLSPWANSGLDPMGKVGTGVHDAPP